MPTKKQVAKVAGSVIVGAVGAYVVRRTVPRSSVAPVIGALIVLILHEQFDAPVSGVIYDVI